MYLKTRTAASFSIPFSFLLFCFCCAFLLTCQYNVFTEIWYPNTPKFYNPIFNTDSSFTNSHKLKSHAHPTHTQKSSQLVSIAHIYPHTQTPHNKYQLSSKTLGPSHPTTWNLQSQIQKLQQPRPRGPHYITTYTHWKLGQPQYRPNTLRSPRHPRRLVKVVATLAQTLANVNHLCVFFVREPSFIG
jgi:hypothetical protein